MFKKISLILAAFMLSVGSGCVSAPNAANALTPDKAGCRKDAQPGDYVACLQLMAQQPGRQDGGFAAGGPAPAPTDAAPPVDQGSAPPPGGMPMGGGMPPGGPMGPGFGGAPMAQASALAPACTQSNRRYQMQFANTTRWAIVPKGRVVLCTSPANLAYIGVNGTMVPAIRPGATVMLGAIMDASCFGEAAYQNHACRISELEFDAYSLEAIAAVGAPGAAGLSALWVGKWMPQAPFRNGIGAEAFVPHEGLPHQGILTPNDRSFRR